jgi:hypothetical protein
MNDLSRPAADRQAWWHLFVLLPRLIFGRCDENVTARQHLDLMASSKSEELYKLVATPKIGRGDPPTPAQIAEEKARLGSLSAAYRALTSNMSRKDIDGEVADQIRQLVITSTPPPEELQVIEPPTDEPVPLRGSSDDTGILYNAMKAMLLGQAPAHILPYLTVGRSPPCTSPTARSDPLCPKIA